MELVRTPAAGPEELLVSGEVDIQSCDALRDAGVRLALESPAGLVIDLAGVTFMDSSGMSALVSIRRAAISSNVPLILRAPSGRVRRILQHTGMLQAFDIAD
jgi:anti-sigma B factor antagonist